MSGLHYYVIPSAANRGRWLVVYRLPGVDRWEAPVADCPTEHVVHAEADRLNGPVLLRAAA
ncbi:MAG TPA: hypothetical protein PLT46_04275 [Burkholderiaceae bacterium]|nr:hypothetical protein [Burkholderiaceae bacterium]